MNDLKELKRLVESDEDLRELVQSFDEMDRVYQAALEAMGQRTNVQPSVVNTAEVTVSFAPS